MMSNSNTTILSSRPSSPPSAAGAPAAPRRRSVSFQKEVYWYYVHRGNGGGDVENSGQWYSGQDLKALQGTLRAEVRAMIERYRGTNDDDIAWSSSNTGEEASYCYRGIEHMRSPAVLAERRRCKNEVPSAVLDEVDRQWEVETRKRGADDSSSNTAQTTTTTKAAKLSPTYDHEAIAATSRSLSERSRELAAWTGARDAVAAAAVLCEESPPPAQEEDTNNDADMLAAALELASAQPLKDDGGASSSSSSLPTTLLHLGIEEGYSMPGVTNHHQGASSSSSSLGSLKTAAPSPLAALMESLHQTDNMAGEAILPSGLSGCPVKA